MMSFGADLLGSAAARLAARYAAAPCHLGVVALPRAARAAAPIQTLRRAAGGRTLIIPIEHYQGPKAGIPSPTRCHSGERREKGVGGHAWVLDAAS